MNKVLEVNQQGFIKRRWRSEAVLNTELTSGPHLYANLGPLTPVSLWNAFKKIAFSLFRSNARLKDESNSNPRTQTIEYQSEKASKSQKIVQHSLEINKQILTISCPPVAPKSQQLFGEKQNKIHSRVIKFRKRINEQKHSKRIRQFQIVENLGVLQKKKSRISEKHHVGNIQVWGPPPQEIETILNIIYQQDQQERRNMQIIKKKIKLGSLMIDTQLTKQQTSQVSFFNKQNDTEMKDSPVFLRQRKVAVEEFETKELILKPYANITQSILKKKQSKPTSSQKIKSKPILKFINNNERPKIERAHSKSKGSQLKKQGIVERKPDELSIIKLQQNIEQPKNPLTNPSNPIQELKSNLFKLPIENTESFISISNPSFQTNNLTDIKIPVLENKIEIMQNFIPEVKIIIDESKPQEYPKLQQPKTIELDNQRKQPEFKTNLFQNQFTSPVKDQNSQKQSLSNNPFNPFLSNANQKISLKNIMERQQPNSIIKQNTNITFVNPIQSLLKPNQQNFNKLWSPDKNINLFFKSGGQSQINQSPFGFNQISPSQQSTNSGIFGQSFAPPAQSNTFSGSIFNQQPALFGFNTVTANMPTMSNNNMNQSGLAKVQLKKGRGGKERIA